MKLQQQSIEWAIRHLAKYSDTDLFPKPLEYDIALSEIGKLAPALASLDLPAFSPRDARRFVVPKANLSFRNATQLYPADSLILSALVYEFGGGIEARRRLVADNVVFSNRFLPNPDGTLYSPAISWGAFWTTVKSKSAKYPYVLVADIADYYNQIYHHTIENQLGECGFPAQARDWIKNLFGHLTAKASRGIPVGPHAAHLLAEMALIPIDNELAAEGIDYCRFVDDFVIFCTSIEDAQIKLNRFSECIDKQQRLCLQKAKTDVLPQSKMAEQCDQMLQDQPISEVEKEVLSVVRKHSGGNPYLTVSVANFGAKEAKLFEREHIETIIESYLKTSDPDFSRLRWFYRRLAQTGATTAVDYSIKNLSLLTPAISDVCHYLVSAGNNTSTDWKAAGDQVIQGLGLALIQSNEYFQLSLLSLFTRNPSMNHFEKLSEISRKGTNNIRRETILAANAHKLADWLRKFKEPFKGMDVWSQNAVIIGSQHFPKEERGFFLKSQGITEPLQVFLRDWSLSR